MCPFLFIRVDNLRTETIAKDVTHTQLNTEYICARINRTLVNERLSLPYASFQTRGNKYERAILTHTRHTYARKNTCRKKETRARSSFHAFLGARAGVRTRAQSSLGPFCEGSFKEKGKGTNTRWPEGQHFSKATTTTTTTTKPWQYALGIALVLQYSLILVYPI